MVALGNGAGELGFGHDRGPPLPPVFAIADAFAFDLTNAAQALPLRE
jgi:hypothetical protein